MVVEYTFMELLIEIAKYMKCFDRVHSDTVAMKNLTELLCGTSQPRQIMLRDVSADV